MSSPITIASQSSKQSNSKSNCNSFEKIAATKSNKSSSDFDGILKSRKSSLSYHQTKKKTIKTSDSLSCPRKYSYSEQNMTSVTPSSSPSTTRSFQKENNFSESSVTSSAPSIESTINSLLVPAEEDQTYNGHQTFSNNTAEMYPQTQNNSYRVNAADKNISKISVSSEVISVQDSFLTLDMVSFISKSEQEFDESAVCDEEDKQESTLDSSYQYGQIVQVKENNKIRVKIAEQQQAQHILQKSYRNQKVQFKEFLEKFETLKAQVEISSGKHTKLKTQQNKLVTENENYVKNIKKLIRFCQQFQESQKQKLEEKEQLGVKFEKSQNEALQIQQNILEAYDEETNYGKILLNQVQILEEEINRFFEKLTESRQQRQISQNGLEEKQVELEDLMQIYKPLHVETVETRNTLTKYQQARDQLRENNITARQLLEYTRQEGTKHQVRGLQLEVDLGQLRRVKDSLKQEVIQLTENNFLAETDNVEKQNKFNSLNGVDASLLQSKQNSLQNLQQVKRTYNEKYDEYIKKLESLDC